MIAPGLFDGCFGHQFSATLGGDNTHIPPTHFTWQRDAYGVYSTFYTDMCLDKARKAPSLKVAWLIEPPSIQDGHYKKAVEMEEVFDYILTFDDRYLERGDKWMYYPLGGCWIDPDIHGLKPKTKMCSLIATEKQAAVGHQLRHAVARRFAGRLDVMGRGYKPIGRKTAGLYDYRYSVVIESIRMDAYFSEKLIDCFALGTVPIYWGCPSIASFFDTRGMIIWDGDLDNLEQILAKVISKRDYERRESALIANYQLVKHYACAEDWICAHYPWLFAGEGERE